MQKMTIRWLLEVLLYQHSTWGGEEVALYIDHPDGPVLVASSIVETLRRLEVIPEPRLDSTLMIRVPRPRWGRDRLFFSGVTLTNDVPEPHAVIMKPCGLVEDHDEDEVGPDAITLS